MQTIEIKKTSDEAKKERTYPYMGISDNTIVWFIKPTTGIAIIYDEMYDKINISSSWKESDFTPMQGDYTFTFKND